MRARCDDAHSFEHGTGRTNFTDSWKDGQRRGNGTFSNVQIVHDGLQQAVDEQY